MTMTSPVPFRRHLRAAVAVAGLALALGGCKTTADEIATSSVPDDYRLRHPIAISEQPRTIEVFVGSARGGLTSPQRADVIALGQTWLREGTGVITIDVPAQTANARAAADSSREIHGLLLATGVPPRALVTRPYTPVDPRLFATIRLNYPRIAASAGPCGTWPEDLGPSVNNKGYYANKPYFNLGCASQRNLAAMIDNPSDLVQPRPETPAYTQRRVTTFDKYKKVTPTAATYPDSDKAKLSDLGK